MSVLCCKARALRAPRRKRIGFVSTFVRLPSRGPKIVYRRTGPRIRRLVAQLYRSRWTRPPLRTLTIPRMREIDDHLIWRPSALGLRWCSTRSPTRSWRYLYDEKFQRFQIAFNELLQEGKNSLHLWNCILQPNYSCEVCALQTQFS